MFGEGQYVGDEAAQWFSSYLNKPGYKMYQMSQPRVICEDEKWGDVGLPEDKVHDIFCKLIINLAFVLSKSTPVFKYSSRKHAELYYS